MDYKLDISKKVSFKLDREIIISINKDWKEIYKSIMSNKIRKKIIIHDGPPYANGRIHLGHAINKIAKDVIIRKKLALGFRVHYKPGWDCHGLPIEIIVGRGKTKGEYKEYVNRQIGNQILGLEKLSCITNWNNNYKTMNKEVIRREIEAFFILLNSKKILIGKREIRFCKNCNSTVSDFEVEKNNKKEVISLILYISKKRRKRIILIYNISISKRLELEVNKKKISVLNIKKSKIKELKKKYKGKKIRKKIRIVVFRCCRHKTILETVKKRQIYINTKVKKKLKDINFFPEDTRKKFISSIFRRPNWCISRQRTWGVKIPLFFNRNKVIKNRKIEKLVIKDIRNWENIILSNKYRGFRKCKDVFDVWLDSGLTHYTILKKRKNISNFPADIYIEGKDQHRGWFNSSYITSMLINKKPPFKNLITHGFALDSKGGKMSKSLNNVISPTEIEKKYSLEILRFFISTSNYYKDISFSEERIRNKVFLMKKVKNVINFMYRNVIKLKNNNRSKKAKMLIDRYILKKTEKAKKNIYLIDKGYESYKSYEILEKFIIKTISSIYISNIKDRLYVLSKKDISKIGCQITMLTVLKDILILVSPYLPYYSEIVWKGLYKGKLLEEKLEERKVDISKKEISSIKIILKIKERYNKIKLKNKEKKLLIIKTRNAKILKPMEKEIRFIIHNYKNIVIGYDKEKLEFKTIKNVIKCNRCLGFSTKIKNKICKRCILIIENKNQERKFF
ncbi:class I tRNA ligase family protein [Candidatus Vidania fulgoroideorum]